VTDSYSISDALRDARARLAPVSDSASLDAQILLCEAMGVERGYLLAHPEALLDREGRERFEALVARRAAGEPIAYILGRRGFYDLDFTVTPDVLIPRPETELLLEAALAFAQTRHACVAADIGTGSGALAVTLARHAPHAEVYAVDVSVAALAVAQGNAERHKAKVTFLQGDLLTPLAAQGVRLNLLMANLPYIASDEVPQLDVSRYEPVLALDGGANGLTLVRRLLADAPALLNPGALVLLEIGADQGAAALTLAQTMLRPRRAEVLKDYAGLDRIVRAEM
jgi:release factor glutamine methyltransferase